MAPRKPKKQTPADRPASKPAVPRSSLWRRLALATTDAERIEILDRIVEQSQ